MSEVLSYRYRAARRDGTMECGLVEARTRDDAGAALRDRGVFPVSVVEIAEPLASRRQLSLADSAVGLHMLGALLEAGLPVARALAILPDLAPPSWTPLILAGAVGVREGKSLVAALDASAVRLPTLAVGIIRAGEGGSGLAGAVRRAATLIEERAQTQSAIRGALAYPFVLATAGLAAIVLLVGVVLPRFAAILGDIGAQLPSSTRIVLAISAVARRVALPAVMVVVPLVIVASRWVATTGGRRRMHELLLALPWLGEARLVAATNRSMAALAALLESGVPIASALRHAAVAAGDDAVAARILAAREDVVRGGRISVALAAHRGATPVAARLARTGEESGRLATMLDYASRLEGERLTVLVRSAVRLVEPALIVIFGGIVALIAAALLQAIYAVRPA